MYFKRQELSNISGLGLGLGLGLDWRLEWRLECVAIGIGGIGEWMEEM